METQEDLRLLGNGGRGLFRWRPRQTGWGWAVRMWLRYNVRPWLIDRLIDADLYHRKASWQNGQGTGRAAGGIADNAGVSVMP